MHIEQSVLPDISYSEQFRLYHPLPAMQITYYNDTILFLLFSYAFFQNLHSIFYL